MSELDSESVRTEKKPKFNPYAMVRSLPPLAIEPFIKSAKEEAIPFEYGHFHDGERYLIVFKMKGQSVRGAYTAIYSESETKKLKDKHMFIMHDQQRICRFVDPKLVYGLFPVLRARKDNPPYIEIGNFKPGLYRNVVVSEDITPYVKTFSPYMDYDFIQVKNIKDFQNQVSDWAVQSLPASLNDPKLLIRGFVGGSKRRKTKRRKTKRRRTRRR